MKEILLKRGLVALVDDEDYEYLNQWKWSVVKTYNGNAYAFRRVKIADYRYKAIMMHNVILNTPVGLLCDHKDRNGLNNQRNNLRLCNRSQNMANRCKWGSQKYKGVVLRKGLFEVRVAKQLVGVYADEKSAALKYNEEALKKFGEFAVLNIII
jgi:hypothetical protein